MESYICSIFCSFYRGGQFIQGYLENVMEQPLFDQIEWVFMDCASPDNERQFIEPLAERFKNVKYHRLGKDPGLYAGWNLAIQCCSADVVGVWCIDDRKSKEGLGILLKELTTDLSLDVVYGLTYLSTTANEKYEENIHSSMFKCLPHSLSNLLLVNSPHCMPLWRWSLHDRFQYFDNSLYSAADTDFWLRCASEGARFKMIDQPIGLYYVNPTGRSTNPDNMRMLNEEVCKVKLHHFKNFIQKGLVQFSSVDILSGKAEFKFNS